MNDKINSVLALKTVETAIKTFVKETPDNPEIKILAIVLMAHGCENDW